MADFHLVGVACIQVMGCFGQSEAPLIPNLIPPQVWLQVGNGACQG